MQHGEGFNLRLGARRESTLALLRQGACQEDKPRENIHRSKGSSGLQHTVSAGQADHLSMHNTIAREVIIPYKYKWHIEVQKTIADN